MEDENYVENIPRYRDQSEEEEDAEEALSLSDLPLDNIHEQVNEVHDRSSKHLHTRRSSADQFFEFFSDFSSDSFMCSAEDIIVCGKLIPFKDHTNEAPKTTCTNNGYHKKDSSFRRRSESLPGLQSSVARSSSTKNQIMMRNSRSLDYQKLHRQSSMVSPTPAEMERNSSTKSVGKYDKKSGNKPKWFFLMFGIVRFPSEMDLSDIKNRQIRRNPSTTLFRSEASDNRSSEKGSWRLLRALSCKDHASVAVTPPYCTQV
ncbi:hypothetical protein ACFX13_013401 [Malus domestica]|nr:uncharacterized protein LOC103410145 isoform X2 [Malus domestica]